MLTNSIPIPCISFHARKICFYSKYERRSHKRKLNPYRTFDPIERLRRNAALMRGRLANCLALLCDSAREKTVYNRKLNGHFKYKIAFATLTFPTDGGKSNRELHYEVFRPFMRRLLKKIPHCRYLWRAELQKRGILHYHIVLDSFIHWRDLRRMWNYSLIVASLNKSGDDNSTDIHSTKHVHDMVAYIAKYIGKGLKDKDGIGLKDWDCSAIIKSVKPLTIEFPTTAVISHLSELKNFYNNFNMYEYVSILRYKPYQIATSPILISLYTQYLSPLISYSNDSTVYTI